jgi:hypothetical protein
VDLQLEFATLNLNIVINNYNYWEKYFEGGVGGWITLDSTKICGK